MPVAEFSAPPAGSVTTDISPPPRAPTILAALLQSTAEERAQDPQKGNNLAAALTEIMLRWSQYWEPVYREGEEQNEFYEGRHYGYASSALNARVAIPQAPKGTIRLTYNYIRRGVERGVSIILKDPPIIKCLAGDSEILDQAASEAADDVVEWRQRSAELAADPERVTRGAFIHGTCFVHEEFDTSAGALVATGEVKAFDVTGVPLDPPEKVMEPQGEYQREILYPRQVVPDAAAQHIFGGSAIFVRKRMSRFDLAKSRPELMIEEFPPEAEERFRRVDAMGRGMTSSGAVGTWDNGLVDGEKDAIEVDICYVPKCASYPKGRRIIFTSTRLVEEMDNPRYPTDEELELGETEPVQGEEPVWPVFPFVHMHRAGKKPFGFSPVHDAIDCNKAINGLASSAVMHAARSKGKWKVPNDLSQELTDETLQVLKVPRRGFDNNTLGWISAPPMPPEYITLWHENKDALYEFLGLNQPAIGQTESSGQSGYAIKLRQQTADNDLEKVRSRHNNMWACIYRYDLFLFRRHASQKRKIEVLGENRKVALKALDGTAIRAGTNVLCVNDASIPRDPEKRMIWLQQFMQTGVMKLPPAERQEMFQLMRLQDFKAFEERKQGDRMRADRQLRRIEMDEEPGEISDMDDHLVQMNVIRDYALTEEFENRVKRELLAGQEEGAPPVPGAPPPTSPTFTRVIKLYTDHKQAYIAQTQTAAPPPQPGAGGPPGAPAGPGAPPAEEAPVQKAA